MLLPPIIPPLSPAQLCPSPPHIPGLEPVSSSKAQAGVGSCPTGPLSVSLGGARFILEGRVCGPGLGAGGGFSKKSIGFWGRDQPLPPPTPEVAAFWDAESCGWHGMEGRGCSHLGLRHLMDLPTSLRSSLHLRVRPREVRGT